MAAPGDRASDFVKRVIEHLQLEDNPRQRARNPDYRGASELARLLGVDKNTVRRWIDGERAPEYAPTMQMLQMCGWLAIDETRETVLVELPPAKDRLAALEARVAELPTAEDLGVAVETLRAAIDRLAKSGRSEAAPGSRRASG